MILSEELSPMAQLHPAAQVAFIVCFAAVIITIIICAFKNI